MGFLLNLNLQSLQQPVIPNLIEKGAKKQIRVYAQRLRRISQFKFPSLVLMPAYHNKRYLIEDYASLNLERVHTADMPTSPSTINRI